MEQIKQISIKELNIAYNIIKQLEKDKTCSNQNSFTQVRNILANKIADRMDELISKNHIIKKYPEEEEKISICEYIDEI